MLGKIKAKIKLNNRGFTLTEMLCATIVVVLVSSCLTLGINLSKNSLETTTTFSKLQILSKTLETEITNELVYAKNINDNKGNLKNYTSDKYGAECTISCNSQGQIILTSTNEPAEYPLLADSAYFNSTVENFSIKYSSGMFTVSFQLVAKNGISKETTFMVKNLNPEKWK